MLALERLNATADDDEQWSYAWTGEGAVNFLYCPWSQFEHEEFDGWVSDLNLPWSEARLRQIENGTTRMKLNCISGDGLSVVAWPMPVKHGSLG